MPLTRRVLLLHGFGGTGASLAVLRQALEAVGWTVAAPDLPGHGASPEPLTPDALIAAGEHHLHALASPDGTPPFVVGHSFGARLALVLPARGVVALSPPAPGHGGDRLGGVKLLTERTVRTPDGAPGLGRCLAALDALPPAAVPTLLLTGERDLPECLGAADAFAGLSPYLEAEVLPGLTHAETQHAPGAIARVRAWLDAQLA